MYHVSLQVQLTTTLVSYDLKVYHVYLKAADHLKVYPVPHLFKLTTANLKVHQELLQVQLTTSKMSSTLNTLTSSLLSTPVLHQKHYPIKLNQRFHASTLLSTPLVHQKHYSIKLTQRFHEVQSSTRLHKASLDSFDLSTFFIIDSPKPRFYVKLHQLKLFKTLYWFI